MNLDDIEKMIQFVSKEPNGKLYLIAGGVVIFLMVALVFFSFFGSISGPSSQVINTASTAPPLEKLHQVEAAPVAAQNSPCPDGQVEVTNVDKTKKCVTPIDPIGDLIRSPSLFTILVLVFPIVLVMSGVIRIRGGSSSLMQMSIGLIGLIIAMVVASSVLSAVTSTLRTPT